MRPIKNPLLRTWVGLGNAVGRLRFRRAPKLEWREVRSCGISCNGHLGDALLAMWAVRELNRVFPDLRLVALTTPANERIVRLSGYFSEVIIWDHWRLNRGKNVVRAIFSDLLGRPALIRKIRAQNLDAACDLYIYYPNHVFLWSLAGVKRLACFDSGGFSAWASDVLPWIDREESVVLAQWRLLNSTIGLGQMRDLSRTALFGEAFGQPVLKETGEPRRLVVLHPGSGSAAKEWPISLWKQLAATFVRMNFAVVLAGRGPRDRLTNGLIKEEVAVTADTTDGLSIPEYFRLLQQADVLVSVDTFAVHAAAAVGCPTVVLNTGINRASHWRPQSERVEVLMAPVPCAPCFVAAGCPAMDCIRLISVEDVVSALRRLGVVSKYD